MLKRWTALILCLVFVLSFSACGGKAADDAGSGRIQISVTFNALKEFAEAVGGTKVEISTIIPDGMEPHDFEPKAQDLTALSTARIFVYNGLGMEAWADEAIQAADNKALIAVDASAGAAPLTDNDTSETNEHGKYDPHIWLSLKGAEAEVTNIKTALVKADPANADYYQANCDHYIAQLESLYSEYKTRFQTVRKNDLVTGHAAFAYLCRDFG